MGMAEANFHHWYCAVIANVSLIDREIPNFWVYFSGDRYEQFMRHGDNWYRVVPHSPFIQPTAHTRNIGHRRVPTALKIYVADPTLLGQQLQQRLSIFETSAVDCVLNYGWLTNVNARATPRIVC